MMIELGGGNNPRGGDWLNIDRHAGPGVDIVCDFERLGQDSKLPLPDAQVIGVYSAHCLEHVRNLKGLLRELMRVCKIGAEVEVRVPAPFSAMALCHDHVQVIPDEQIEHWCRTAIPYWFAGCPRRLSYVRTERVPGGAFAEAKQIFPHLSDDQLMRFIPNACHEHAYYLVVVPYDQP